MNQELKNRIAKIYELVNRGATDGERAAAKNQLDKLLKKYNLSEEAISNIHLSYYGFMYSSNIEYSLLIQLFRLYTPPTTTNSLGKRGKCLYKQLTYTDYVLVDCMYQYFKRHAKAQWNKRCAIEIAKCRKAKTKSALRNKLQEWFIPEYLYQSKLYVEGDFKEVDTSSLSAKQIEYLKKVGKVEGGKYNTQLHTHLQLEN
jgi:hypothetical protein